MIYVFLKYMKKLLSKHVFISCIINFKKMHISPIHLLSLYLLIFIVKRYFTHKTDVIFASWTIKTF